MTFWLLTILISAIAMGFVCYPMLGRNVRIRSEADSEQTLYKARLSEIEKDLELGRLDEISAKAARAEEARRLIKTSENSKVLKQTAGNKFLIIAAAISLPVFSLPFYLSIGSPQTATAINVVDTGNAQPTMEQLLKVAESRLQINPDDTNGWKVVAPVYIRMARYDDAIKAYENILRVEGESPEFLLKLADVYIEQNNGTVTEEAKNLVSRILSIDEDNSIARFYTGIIALQSDKPDETMRIWQAMLDEAQGDEEWLPIVKGRIEELRSLNQTSKSPVLDEEILQAAENMSPDERLTMIGQMVSSLSEKLQENPNDKQGWQRLISSYMVLDRKEDAEIALANAQKYFSDDKSFVQTLENIVSNNSIISNGENQ